MAVASPQAKVFANAGLALLKNNLVMAKLCDSEAIQKEYDAPKPHAIGPTVSVKRPPEFIVRNGATAVDQNVTEGEAQVTIDQYIGVDVPITSIEYAMQVGDLLKNQFVKSAMVALSTRIDMDLARRVNEFHNFVGTAGATVASPAAFFAAPQRMDEMAIPQSDRNAIITPQDGYAMAGSLLANAGQDANGVAGSALKNAKIPMLGNVDPYLTQTVPSITCGTRTNGTMGGAGQEVLYETAGVRIGYTQTLNLAGLGANATIAAGEVFTIAGVNAVNPRTKQTLPYLQQFTVLNAVTAAAGGTATVTISPPMIATGAFQIISAPAAAAAAVTWYGNPGQVLRSNAAFHKSAIKLVSVKLVRPSVGECEFATDPDTGLSIRYWQYSDGRTDTHNHRWDVFYGTANLDRRLGTRFAGV